MWARYNYAGPLTTHGQRLDADIALDQCRRGQYQPAIDTLEDILRRMKTPIPSR